MRAHACRLALFKLHFLALKFGLTFFFLRDFIFKQLVLAITVYLLFLL